MLITVPFAFLSCGKRTVPTKTATIVTKKTSSGVSAVNDNITKPKPAPETKKTDTAATVIASPVEKTVETDKPKTAFPKVITVNDNAASKSVDGRLFYDVLGHRYWRNYKDGKYYLFDKSMYNNPDFSPPK